MSTSRSILLVGEGNFSFSASACQLYSESGTSITATCLQHQEEALRHEGAASNIQIIKDAGGTVLFDVDCTKLGECAALQGRVFDRVVFNFPHCGRKSGVKKNRELLKNFFHSCVHVLAEDGEVHIALCNGQGGTPADQPKREWHNSWQVVSMAAEAQFILSAVHPFESEKHQNYKCTGYSQDKGFHVQKALLHIFTRSLPYTASQVLHVEEDVEGKKVQYNMPAELSDYSFRGLLSSDSVHPVKLVQDFLLEGLAEKWLVSMTTETIPYLLTAKQLQNCCCNVDTAHCYWIHVLQKDLTFDSHTTDKEKDQGDPKETLSDTCVASSIGEKVRSTGAEKLRSACSLDDDPEEECSLYVLRPSLLPQMEELLNKPEGGNHTDGNNRRKKGNETEEASEDCNGMKSLFGISNVVFRNMSISHWAPPAFHELLLGGDVPSEKEPVKLLGHKLTTLLAPYGISIITDQEGLRLMAQPMGFIGKVFSDKASNNDSHVRVMASLNLDLLAVRLFSLPDWRLLWSHDPRFLKQFSLRPSPGTQFHPFSLFPEHFSFDISFWTGPTWEEKKFHAIVRQAGHGTVEHVKLMDTFSHPDLSQTSYCYRLIYHSNTHALSHTQVLQFHKHLESLLSTQLQVTIR
ncbi:ferredoxin-fold anticodon-binding domain-containing protein 1 isoform X2 [Parambassis ranga]|uniref:Ferredoxin-fold anticodon-binding domain-containing protein 1 isoform X2 n=1 Tax=Parambassis ranga TaxID=210632 RepID=A0A6P7JL17_9TELE|nr:ferredoxin-fold anticodon-binding domain-containing protein 1 isoform X2 [Parambassis ranga]